MRMSVNIWSGRNRRAEVGKVALSTQQQWWSWTKNLNTNNRSKCCGKWRQANKVWWRGNYSKKNNNTPTQIQKIFKNRTEDIVLFLNQLSRGSSHADRTSQRPLGALIKLANKLLIFLTSLSAIPLPPHSKAGISCWWPSANAHSLTENLLWRWARETEEGESYRIEMHVMMVPSGKIWKVYTAGTLCYLSMPERQTTTKITHKH